MVICQKILALYGHGMRIWGMEVVDRQ